MNNDIEIYKIFNDRVTEEIKEFYKVNEIFLAINSGLLAVTFTLKIEQKVFSALFCFISFIIACIWYKSNIKINL